MTRYSMLIKLGSSCKGARPTLMEIHFDAPSIDAVPDLALDTARFIFPSPRLQTDGNKVPVYESGTTIGEGKHIGDFWIGPWIGPDTKREVSWKLKNESVSA